MVAFLVWAPVASAWSWPVQGPVLRSFSYDEAHPYDAGQHRGIDIGATAAGDPVVAPESGTVSFAGFVPTSGESLTVETADGYSVTLTHLGSVGVAEGETVAEGDVVGTVGPSGTPEQTVPYVHFGVRLTTDPLGYVDPLGLLPPFETTPTPTPTATPRPVSTVVPVAKHPRGGGLVIKKPAVSPPSVAAPAEPAHVAEPRPEPSSRPKPSSRPEPAPVRAARTLHADAPQIRRTIVDPVAQAVPVVVKPYAHAIEAESLVLSIGPGIVASLLALVMALARSRRQAPIPAKVIAFRKELPLRNAA